MADTEAQLQVGDRIITVRVRQPEAYATNPTNGNRGRERGVAAIEGSLQGSGFHRGIVTAANDTVVNGNHAYQVAAANQVVAGWVEVEVEGDIGVATKRIDWANERDPRAIKAAIEDNRTNQLNFELDPGQFEEDLQALKIAGLELPATLFTDAEIDFVITGEYLGDDEPPDTGKDEGDGGAGTGTASGSGSLRDKFIIPPFSVLDARQGYWQERKRQWLALGIQSELGRGGG